MRILPSSDEEDIEEFEEHEFKRDENVMSSVEEEEVGHDMDQQSSGEDIPPMFDDESDRDPFYFDQVEDFITDQEDAFSQVSNFSNKESIHAFSENMSQSQGQNQIQSQSQSDIQTPIQSQIPLLSQSQSQVQSQSQSQSQSQNQSQILYRMPNSDEYDAIDEEYRKMYNDWKSPVVDTIGPDSFILSEEESSEEDLTDVLASAESIIKKDLKAYRIWDKQVEEKIDKYGSVLHAFYDDESVLILKISRAWVQYGLVFARCSIMYRDEVYRLAQSKAKQSVLSFDMDSASVNTDNDTVHDFSQEEPLDTPEEKTRKEETQEEEEVEEEEGVLFIFSFAMYPNTDIDELANSQMVAVWDPFVDMDKIPLLASNIPFHISTITRFKIVA